LKCGQPGRHGDEVKLKHRSPTAFQSTWSERPVPVNHLEVRVVV
jgi:hypothetical protein